MIDRAVHLHKKSEPAKPEIPKAEPAKTLAAKSKPVATPARSAPAIPAVVEEPPQTPKLSRTTTDVEMGMADAAVVEQADNPKPSPMSIASTPMKSPVSKKLKGSIGSTESLASSVPSLPSFSGSSASDRRPHHSDSATTLSLGGYFQSMRLHEGSQDLSGILEETCSVCGKICTNEDGCKIYCTAQCLMKALTDMVAARAAPETSVDAAVSLEASPASKASQLLPSTVSGVPEASKPEIPGASQPLPTEATSEIPGASQPLPAEASSVIPASQPLPTEASSDISGASQPLPTEATSEIPGASQPLPAEASSVIPASQPLPTEASSEIPGASQPLPTEASSEIPGASEPLPTQASSEIPRASEPLPAESASEPIADGKLEHDLERLMVLEEATIAQHRAEAAVQMQEAVNKLCLAMLKHRSLDTVRSAKIQAMLKRQDSLDDIENMTAELEKVEEEPAPKVTAKTPVATPSPPPAPVPPAPVPRAPEPHAAASEAKAGGKIEVKKEETEGLDGEPLKPEETADGEEATAKEAKRSNNCPPEIYSKVFHPNGKSSGMAA
ncbi:xynB [Symbiodinium sp. CCMP2592]|nr:xynB [Symbiodinium sp. CCMP2592]